MPDFFIRIIRLESYSKDKGRFRDDVIFQNYNDGVSIFDRQCAELSTTEGICTHIRKYYPKTAKEPPVYWLIPKENITGFEWGNDYELRKTISTSGDKCHYDLINISQADGEAFAKKYCQPQYLFICTNGEAVAISKEMFNDLKAWAKKNCACFK